MDATIYCSSQQSFLFCGERGHSRPLKPQLGFTEGHKKGATIPFFTAYHFSISSKAMKSSVTPFSSLLNLSTLSAAGGVPGAASLT